LLRFYIATFLHFYKKKKRESYKIGENNFKITFVIQDKIPRFLFEGTKNVDSFFRLLIILVKSSIAFLSENIAQTSAFKANDKKSIF